MAAAAEHDHQPPGAAIAPARPVSLWWLHPVVVVIALVVPTFLAALWYSPQHYRAAWRTAKWVDWDTAWLVGPAAAALVLGCVVGAALVRRGPHAPHGPDGPHGQASWPVLAPSTEAVLQRAFPVLVRITFVAYALWAVALLARGFTPAGLLDLVGSGRSYDAEVAEQLQGIPGITTLTQVGVAAVTVGALIDLRRPSAQVRRALLVLLVLATLRSYLFAERLALIELVVPWVVVRAAGLVARPEARPSTRRLVRAAPLIALPLVFAVFAGFELTRSWTYFSSETDDSYLSFATDRFVGYYATSYNNGQVVYDHYRWPTKLPYYSLEFVWSFPLVEQLANFEDVTEPRPSGRERSTGLVLERYANPEFNSPNGLISPAVDYGPIGGPAFMAAVGAAIGALHQSFRRGRVTGLLVYPVVFVGLLEVPRALYWTLGRTFPVLVTLVVLLALVGRAARREASWSAPSPLPAAGGTVRPVGATRA